MRYGMVIDLKRCFGCNACTIICKQRHSTPPGVAWSRVYEYEEGVYPNARRHFKPALCMHCADPACVKVCPTGASYKNADGTVLVDQGKCIGCRYCMVACPYESRFQTDPGNMSYFPQADACSYEEATRGDFTPGTVSKCVRCDDRVSAGLVPACVQACPTQARLFGDLDDPESEVSRAIRKRGGYQVNPEFGTDPSVYYLP